jgi:hypothetical protein
MTTETSNQATLSHLIRDPSVHREFEVRMILPDPPHPEISTIGGIANSSSYMHSRNES